MKDIITPETIEKLQTVLVETLTTYGFKVLGAIAVWFIGLFVIKRILKITKVTFDTSDFDPALETFLQSFLGFALKVVLVVIVISMLGVQTTSFVALLGAAGLAVGLALQGSLANFAGGALLLFFKPFTVGDRIETSGHTGTVERIQILYTVLRNANNQRIIIPNGELSNNSIKNYFANEYVGVEIDFGIDYGDDFDKAKRLIKEIMDADKRILKDPKPMIIMNELGDNAVIIRTRSFVATSQDYWAVYADMTEAVKKKFDAESISFPFPQRDVHVYKHDN